VQKITSESLERIGSAIHGALAELIANQGRFPRPTELARRWELDQTLCVRTCRALRHEEPLRVLHHLPSTGSLRSILAAGRSHGAPAAICSRVATAIDGLEAAISALGGKKANLDTLIGSQLLEAREKIEATSKQSIFRGMSNLLGLQCDVSLTSYFVYPSEDDPERCDELAIYGSSGLRRLRPELPILVGGRILFGEPSQELSQAHEVLYGGKLDRSGFSVALKEFSTDPFPEVRVIQSGTRLIYTLPADGGGESQELAMFFASIDRHASERWRRRDGAAAPFVFVPRNPAKEFLLDVFVHRDVWPGSEPSLEIGRGENVLTPLAAVRSDIDRLDLRESFKSFGAEPTPASFAPLPRYSAMLARVCEDAGLAMEDFRVHRLHVKYPVISLSYALFFPLPDPPRGARSAASGTS